MKSSRSVRWQRHRHRLPIAMHVVELAVAVVILSAGQNVWAQLVGADPDITPPSVPGGLSLSARSASTADISWTASTDDVGVTGYKIYRNGAQVGTAATTAYSDSGLTPNTAYTYTVGAYDAAANDSAQSSGLPISTLADTLPPSVPANVHQTGQSTNSVTIAWNASTDNVAVTSYDIFRNGLQVSNQTGTTFTDSGLAVYSGYSYNVIARDGAGNTSGLSTTLVASTAPDTTPPSVPDNLQKTGSTISSISLTWNTSTDDVGVAGYRVYRDGSLIGTPGGASFTDTGLSVGSTYTYTVLAYDAATNQSAQSAPYSTASSNDTTPPTIPANLHTTAILDTSITLAWNISTDDVSVTGYKIYRNNTLVGTSQTAAYNDTGLSPVSDYTYTVQAYDAANNTSAASATLSVTTAYDTTPPSVPANLRTTAQTDTTISLAWDVATDNVGVSGYDLYRGSTLITSTVGTTFTDTGLSVDAPYSYRIRAHDDSGNNSAQSSPHDTETLPDAVLPLTPTNLTATSKTTTSISLAWDASTDDVGVTGYRLYRGNSLIASPTGLTYTDNSRTYNTTYTYSISAVDAAGNESVKSALYSVSTLPDTTPPVVTLTSPSNGQTRQLTFAITATASDNLALNRVEFYVDSTRIATKTSAPFGLNWDSYAVHNGSHSITAKAYDATGNVTSHAVSVTINNPPPSLYGDLNGDHKVNIFDLSILLSHWRKGGSGDFNNNGKVDIFDLSILLARYGQDNSNYN